MIQAFKMIGSLTVVRPGLSIPPPPPPTLYRFLGGAKHELLTHPLPCGTAAGQQLRLSAVLGGVPSHQKPLSPSFGSFKLHTCLKKKKLASSHLKKKTGNFQNFL